jgi:hypothetical protein
MMGARQMIAVTITFRKSNKNSLEQRAGAYRSSGKRNTLYLQNMVDAYYKIYFQIMAVLCSSEANSVLYGI